MTSITTQMATAIASAWLNEVPLHLMAEATAKSYVDIMDVVRAMRLPDRHPTTRKVYDRGGFVD